MKSISLLLLLFVSLASCNDFHGKEVSENGKKLYYVDPVTETEAKKVLSWLISINHNWGEPAQPFQLSKSGNTYIFRYPAQNNSPEEIEGNMGYITTFREKLSQDALNGAPVEVYIVDEDMKELKRITP